jgi:hypothetical protein
VAVEGRYSRTMSSWRIAAGQVGEKSSGGGAGNGPAIAAFPSSFPCGIAQLAEEGGRGPSSFLPFRPAARSFSPVAFPSVGRSVPVVVTHTVHERSGASRGREGFASPQCSAAGRPAPVRRVRTSRRHIPRRPPLSSNLPVKSGMC